MSAPINRRSIIRLLLSAAVLFCIVRDVRADPTALDVTAAGGVFGCVGSTGCIAGWDFHVNSPIGVDSLGIWDQGSAGISENHTIGLWTLSGTSLATAVVTNASAAVPSSSSAGDWRFAPITLKTLGPGDYVIGAFYNAGSPDLLQGLATVSTIPQITLGNARDDFSSSLVYPKNVFPTFDAGFFGPNFQVVQSVPEPSTILLLGTALIGLAVRARRSKHHEQSKQADLGLGI